MSSLRPARSAPGRALFALGTRRLRSIDAKATELLKHTSMIVTGLGLIASLVAELPLLYFWSLENTA
jgi:hypothetical protein